MQRIAIPRLFFIDPTENRADNAYLLRNFVEELTHDEKNAYPQSDGSAVEQTWVLQFFEFVLQNGLQIVGVLFHSQTTTPMLLPKWQSSFTNKKTNIGFLTSDRTILL